MLFKQRFWEGLADGTITVTFRRWRRPQARPSGRYRTPAGVLAVEAVERVGAEAITELDAHRAGYRDRSELLADLDRYGTDSPAYRVEFHFAGADPREALRRSDDLASSELAELAASIGRERAAFKTDVRKLKELGLTESLGTGYRLSPRGRALLTRFDEM